MKRILILGASGTFGKALVEKLNNDEEFHLTLASVMPRLAITKVNDAMSSIVTP